MVRSEERRLLNFSIRDELQWKDDTECHSETQNSDWNLPSELCCPFWGSRSQRDRGSTTPESTRISWREGQPLAELQIEESFFLATSPVEEEKEKTKRKKKIQAGRDLWHRQGCRTHRCWARDRRRRPACRISRRPSRSPSIAQLPPTALAIGLRRGAYKFIEVWIAVQCGAVQCSAVRCSKSELLSSCEGGKGKGQGRREGKPIVQILVVCIRERKSRPRVLSPLNIYMIIQLQKSCQLPPQLICDCSSTAWKLPWSASQGSSIDGFPTDSYVQRRCSALGH